MRVNLTVSYGISCVTVGALLLGIQYGWLTGFGVWFLHAGLRFWQGEK